MAQWVRVHDQVNSAKNSKTSAHCHVTPRMPQIQNEK